MHSIRTVLKLAAIASCGVASAAFAQDGTAADGIRNCRGIADAAARVACYDAIDVGRPAAATAPAPAPQAAPAPRPAGFGSNQLPRAAQPRAEDADRIEAGIASVTEREPGILLLTMQDDTQWLTVDTVRQSYRRPPRGSTVEIVSAAMGSYLMRYGDQGSVRVRRVK